MSEKTESNPAADDPATLKPIHLARPPKIVLVDDEPCMTVLIGEVLRIWLKEPTILQFNNSIEACEELSQRDPDLLITDVVMPLMNGLDICHLLLKRKAAYPIIVWSTLPGCENCVQKFARQGLNVRLLQFSEPDIFTKLHTLIKQMLTKNLT
jgi:CheY-like chemotaxis protein